MQELKAKEIFAVVFSFAVLGILGFSLAYDDNDVVDEVKNKVPLIVNEQRLNQIEQTGASPSNSHPRTVVVTSNQ